jgi:Triose-phosphate Transporter family
VLSILYEHYLCAPLSHTVNCSNRYNEVAFLALDAVHPVTHAVGNTLKRVFVIVSSVVLFKTPLTNQGIVGSAIAIIGVLIYSLVKVRDTLQRLLYCTCACCTKYKSTVVSTTTGCAHGIDVCHIIIDPISD